MMSSHKQLARGAEGTVAMAMGEAVRVVEEVVGEGEVEAKRATLRLTSRASPHLDRMSSRASRPQQLARAAAASSQSKSSAEHK